MQLYLAHVGARAYMPSPARCSRPAMGPTYVLRMQVHTASVLLHLGLWLS